MQAHGQNALIVGGSKGVGLAVGLPWLTFALYPAMNRIAIEILNRRVLAAVYTLEAARIQRNSDRSVNHRRPAKCGCEGHNRYCVKSTLQAQMLRRCININGVRTPLQASISKTTTATNPFLKFWESRNYTYFSLLLGCSTMTLCRQ